MQCAQNVKPAGNMPQVKAEQLLGVLHIELFVQLVIVSKKGLDLIMKFIKNIFVNFVVLSQLILAN